MSLNTRATTTNVFVCVALLACQNAAQAMISSYFYDRHEICGIQERFKLGCIHLEAKSRRSPVQCALVCREAYGFCERMILDDQGKCYLHSDCGVDENTLSCTSEDKSYSAFRIVQSALGPGSCINEGTFNPTTSKCVCKNNWAGTFCERRPHSCEDLWKSGYAEGNYWEDMNLLGQPGVTKMACTLGKDFVKTYVSINTGQRDFNMTYERFKMWIYGGPDLYWIGLENMHKLNAVAKLSTLVLLTTISGSPLMTTYAGVTVGDESTGYELYYSSAMLHRNDYSLSLEECLPKHLRFSTYDKDNDNSFRNLAYEAGSGWWYDYLGNFCNPNGKKPTSSSTSDQLEYVHIRGIDLTYDAHGKDFESTQFFFIQNFYS